MYGESWRETRFFLWYDPSGCSGAIHVALPLHSVAESVCPIRAFGSSNADGDKALA